MWCEYFPVHLPPCRPLCRRRRTQHNTPHTVPPNTTHASSYSTAQQHSSPSQRIRSRGIGQAAHGAGLGIRPLFPQPLIGSLEHNRVCMAVLGIACACV